MSEQLFIKNKNKKNILNFTKEICNILNLSNIETRHSSFYVNEEYYVVKSLGIEITFAVADEIDYANDDLWISLKLEPLIKINSNFLKELASIIACKIASYDYEVAIPDNFGQDSKKTIYRKNPSEKADFKESIIIEHLDT